MTYLLGFDAHTEQKHFPPNVLSSHLQIQVSQTFSSFLFLLVVPLWILSLLKCFTVPRVFKYLHLTAVSRPVHIFWLSKNWQSTKHMLEALNLNTFMCLTVSFMLWTEQYLNKSVVIIISYRGNSIALLQPGGNTDTGNTLAYLQWCTVINTRIISTKTGTKSKIYQKTKTKQQHCLL